jgi:aminopeptidase-like protein
MTLHNIYAKKIYKLACILFPICRSLTGDGNRKTLKIIQSILPDLRIFEKKTGTKVYDWEVPNEWNIKDAYILNEKNKKILDFKNNNLHVVSYSTPINKKISLKELKKKIHYNKNMKEAIPYVTSYYKKDWGFCMSYKQFKKLNNKTYKIKIDSSLKPGSLTYADILIEGKSKKEILFSTYICHPSMGNNEISGPVLATYLANYIKTIKKRRYSYRFVFSPENIGSVIYINKNLNILKKNVVAAFNITCVGDDNNYSFIPSKNENTLSNKSALHVLNHTKKKFTTFPFLEYSGSDERRYCSPGVDLPMCSIMRSKYGSYKEYHTSKDDLNFISIKGFEGSFAIYSDLIEILENNYIYKIKTICEPQLSKRGLYPKISKWPVDNYKEIVGNLTSVMSLADGKNDLIDISNKINVSYKKVLKIILSLKKHNLIKTL